MVSYKQESWDLSSVLPTDLEAKIISVRDGISAFGKNKELLKPGMTEIDFLKIMQEYESLSVEMMKLSLGVGLRFSENTSNSEAAKGLSIVDSFGAESENAMRFFTHWIKGLDDANFERLSRNTGDFKSFLNRTRKDKPYTLSEEVEKVITFKDTTGESVHNRLYDQLTSGFKFNFLVDGKRKQINESELRSYFFDESPDLRRQASEKLLKKHSEFGPIFAELYKATALDWHNEQIKLRGYTSPIGVRNFANEMSDLTVENLLDSCRENVGVFQDYFMLKSRLINVNGKMSRTDIYAPIKETSSKRFTFEEASALVLENFESFSPEMAGLARNIFESRHLHSAEGKNKSGGAFCYPSPPGIAPFVLVNYKGKLEDASTIAHELGHGVHDQLAAQEHGVLTADPPLPLAETASIFSEMVFFDRLLLESSDKTMKKEILVSQIDSMYKSIIRQAYFVMFEKEAHDKINSPQGAGVDELNGIYGRLVNEQFGRSIEIPKAFESEWMVIPHIYQSPFYCYAYAFGQLLTLSLYNNYMQEGKSFIPKLRKVLAYGGAAAPEKILAEAGLDITKKEFWQNGFDLIGKKVEALEKLV